MTWPHAPLREFTAAGLTILERQLLTLYRAGIRVVHVDAAFAPEAVARARTEKM
ncbi:MAG: hypothetical protein HY551_01740, partial [Elusimicrobia bacterium]|nr:hypothetical protein [Elusimicrobiota bacterium]